MATHTAQHKDFPNLVGSATKTQSPSKTSQLFSVHPVTISYPSCTAASSINFDKELLANLVYTASMRCGLISSAPECWRTRQVELSPCTRPYFTLIFDHSPVTPLIRAWGRGYRLPPARRALLRGAVTEAAVPPPRLVLFPPRVRATHCL